MNLTQRLIADHLLSGGAIINEALKAQQILAEKYKVSSDVWSVTSYTNLRRDALDAERWNLLNAGKREKKPYVSACLENEKGIFVAASDYMKALPDGISKWVPGRLITLGTDGFGRSDTREGLRRFFEVDAQHIVYSALVGLFKEGKLEAKSVQNAAEELSIDPGKPNPMTS